MVNQVPWLAAWEMQGEKTVVLGVETIEEMKELASRAQARTLLVYLVNKNSVHRVQLFLSRIAQASNDAVLKTSNKINIIYSKTGLTGSPLGC